MSRNSWSINKASTKNKPKKTVKAQAEQDVREESWAERDVNGQRDMAGSLKTTLGCDEMKSVHLTKVQEKQKKWMLAVNIHQWRHLHKFRLDISGVTKLINKWFIKTTPVENVKQAE